MWKSTQDLIEAIHAAHERLLSSDDVDVRKARAEAKLFTNATQVMHISLEHARLTNRLYDGDDCLPITHLGSGRKK